MKLSDMGGEHKHHRCRLGQAFRIVSSTVPVTLNAIFPFPAYGVSLERAFPITSNHSHVQANILFDASTMFAFLRDATETAGFVPRWQSENWVAPHAWLYISSVFATSAACLFLAAALSRVYRMHSSAFYAKAALLFCAFFLAAGTANLLEGLVFWWPAYRLNAITLAAEAAIAIVLAVYTVRFVPQLASLRSSSEIQQEIVQRRRTELELRKVHAQLEGVIQQRTAELASKNEEMEQFLNTVSHDLKSPIVTCLGLVSSLREDIEAGRIEDTGDTITRIERSVTRMRRLIEDVLNLSRIGKIRFELADVDTNSILRSICEEFQPRVAKVNAVLEVETALPQVHADAHWLTEIFENLINNALKYGCDNPQPRIAIGCVNGEKEHRFYVRDNGRGIDPANHARIFEPFRRLKTDKEGSGMGLAIVVRIVRMHGGRIWIDSQVGQGATFWIALPTSIRPLVGGIEEKQPTQQNAPVLTREAYAA